MRIDRKLTYIQLIGIILASWRVTTWNIFFNRTLSSMHHTTGFTGDIITYDFG